VTTTRVKKKHRHGWLSYVDTRDLIGAQEIQIFKSLKNYNTQKYKKSTEPENKKRVKQQKK
jgi:hypothetical protein